MCPVKVKPIEELKSLSDLGGLPIYQGGPSPGSWRDQIMYFLMPDRFSDGNEEDTQMFDYQSPSEFRREDLMVWKDSGDKFQGGTINGVTSKLDYLKSMGVTTIWLGPVFRQRADLETYHGYGIQNFLDVDPRFGTREDLKDLVKEAHSRGMYVVLDIIYNHTGNNWYYDTEGTKTTAPYRYAPKYELGSWRSKEGQAVHVISENALDDGVWPVEFQDPNMYTRAGSIGAWDHAQWENPLHPDTEFRRGDFCDLKDIDYNNPDALSAVIRVYQYWIGLTDCDGFRIDTVKHVPWEVSRNFCGAIHEYAEMLGKDNFLLLGEVTGGESMSRSYLEILGRNVDAVLDIGGAPSIIEGVAKGMCDPEVYFNQFDSQNILGSHREIGRYHVSVLDDHDKVGRDKRRFAAGYQIDSKYKQVAHAVGLQLTTLGIPCIYYGTEQAFEGDGNAFDASGDDRFLRETMFSSKFSAFGTNGCHFFNENHPTYLRIKAIAAVRESKDKEGLALRRGRQYLREISVMDGPFMKQGKGELTAWSRIIGDQEVLVVYNTNGTEVRGGKVTIHAPFYQDKTQLKALYNSEWDEDQLQAGHNMSGEHEPVLTMEDGRCVVDLLLPPAGMMILA